MTDREAIRRLAGMLLSHAQVTFVSVEHPVFKIIERETQKIIGDLAEPAAPTVTREQAEQVKSALAYYFDAKDFGAMGPNWPAFFRAVADALEGR